LTQQGTNESCDPADSANKEAPEGRICSEVSLTEFTYFRKLPKELRDKIWKAAAFLPRNVDIWLGSRSMTCEEHSNDDRYGRFYFFYSGIIPPAILHTCHESRIEGLAHYKLEFGVQHNVQDHEGRGPSTLRISFDPSIYVNGAVDALCIMEPTSFKLNRAYKEFTSRTKARNLQSLAFNLGYTLKILFWPGKSGSNHTVVCLTDFYLGYKGLRKILIFDPAVDVRFPTKYQPRLLQHHDKIELRPLRDFPHRF
jgi:hypothetical protein